MQHAARRRQVRERHPVAQAAQKRVGGAVRHAGQQHAARGRPGSASATDVDHLREPLRVHVLAAHDRPRAVARRGRQQSTPRERASASQLHRKSRPWPLPPWSATTSGIGVRAVPRLRARRARSRRGRRARSWRAARPTRDVVVAQRSRAQARDQRVVIAARRLEEPAAHRLERRRQRIERLLDAREASQRAVEADGIVRRCAPRRRMPRPGRRVCRATSTRRSRMKREIVRPLDRLERARAARRPRRRAARAPRPAARRAAERDGAAPSRRARACPAAAASSSPIATITSGEGGMATASHQRARRLG